MRHVLRFLPLPYLLRLPLLERLSKRGRGLLVTGVAVNGLGVRARAEPATAHPAAWSLNDPVLFLLLGTVERNAQSRYT